MTRQIAQGMFLAVSVLMASSVLAGPSYIESINAPTDSANFAKGADTVTAFDQWLVVGSPASSDSHVTIYRRTTASSGQPHYVPFQTINAIQGGSYFGTSVAISKTDFRVTQGETLLFVGAPKYDTYGYTDSGLVFVYEYDDAQAVWTQKNVIYPPSQEAYSWFGHSLDASHQRLIVGAPYQDYLGYTDSGVAFTFHVDSATNITSQGAHVSAYGIEAYAHAGWSVDLTAMDYSHVDQTWYHYMIGSPDHDGAGNNAGRVELCREKVDVDSTSAPRTCRLMAPSSVAAYDRFGYAVSVDGNKFAAGAPKHDVGNKTNAGAVYLAQWIGDSFEYLYTWTSFNYSTSYAQAYAEFGSTVAIVDRYGLDGPNHLAFDAVAGAPNQDYSGYSNMGRVFTFERKYNSSLSKYVDTHRALPAGGVQVSSLYEGSALFLDTGRRIFSGAPSNGSSVNIQDVRFYTMD